VPSVEKHVQRASRVLKDVDYVIEAHFDVVDKNADPAEKKKHYNIVLRRLRDGQHFHAPCFGTREFSAKVEIIEDRQEVPQSPLKGNRDFGWMLYDLDFSNPLDAKPKFFQAKMIDGVIDLRGVEVHQ
jgi:CRISPR-associated protein Cas5d